MIYEIRGIQLNLDDHEDMLRQLAAKKAKVPVERVEKLWIRRRSIDARKGKVAFVHTLGVEISGKAPKGEVYPLKAEEAWSGPFGREALMGPIVVVGAGPCGLMAAYTLVSHGYPVVLLERGGRMAERDAATDAFHHGGELNEDNNLLFGEGGAGAYSDGKLTARNKDASARRVLELLIKHGADGSIGYDAKPHIGTDVLKKVVSGVTDSIMAMGGKVLFHAKLTGLCERDGVITELRFCYNGTEQCIQPGAVVLAIGHSARDTYRMLHDLGTPMEQKPFAVGARIEHHQSMIDATQYGSFAGHPKLGAAEYALTARAGDRGVYTFCMCPGGYVVPSVNIPHRLCVNGMSYHKRDGVNANSALVVQVGPKDFYEGPLGGMEFQERLERAAFDYTGSYAAPMQRVEDLLKGRKTTALGDVKPTYPMGSALCHLNRVLPDFIVSAMAEAIPQMARRLKGFDAPDAVLTGVEGRTSAPVRIVRNESGISPFADNLYPAGEGSGYAGGIVSAGADGIRTAQSIMERFSCEYHGFTL
ncbi:MAG: hypothetical protein E7328_00305 [Clostridiales bacterium]|nr:hypothetical protein [Clostridiales bacterium]